MVVTLRCQECSKKFYQLVNHKLQAGSWLKKFPSREAARKFLVSPRGVWGHAPLENFEDQKFQIG